MTGLRECNKCGVVKPEQDYRPNIWWCRECEWQEAKHHADIRYEIEFDRKLRPWLTALVFVILLVSFVMAPLIFFGIVFSTS